MKTEPRDFLLNTDYEMDKIVYFKSGEFTGETNFDHNLSFTPLIFGVWSTSSDFSDSNTLCTPDISYEPGATNPLGVYAVVRGDNGQIKIKALGDGSNNTKIYYRLYALEPNDSSSSAPHTSNSAKQFIMNTDYNYRKLKASGVFTQNGQEYQHNLGYIPHVVAWMKDADAIGGNLEPISWASPFTGIYMTVTANAIKVTFPNGWVEKVYWRIYYDET